LLRFGDYLLDGGYFKSATLNFEQSVIRNSKPVPWKHEKSVQKYIL